MNTFAAVLVACLVAYTSASTCTDICEGSCDIANAQAKVTFPLLDPLSEVQHDACKSVCQSTCACVDNCESVCGPKLEECQSQQANGTMFTNPFLDIECKFEYVSCTNMCQLSCGVTTVAGAVGTMSGAESPDKS